MKSPLRRRILAFTAVPMVVLTLGALWVVHRTVSERVHQAVEQDLRRASLVFEDMLGQRAEQLRIASAVVARDPRFFAVLTLPGSHRDPVYRNTVVGVAKDFNAITDADVLEVYDARGMSIASVGREHLRAGAAKELVAAAREGTMSYEVVAAGDRHFQVIATPVVTAGQVAGVLVVGAGIGAPLAAKLREQTRSDVSFVAGGALSGTTLTRETDRGALLEAVATRRGHAPSDAIIELAGSGDTYLTLLRPLPGSRAGDAQAYAIQRSLKAETAFLREVQVALAQLGLLAVLLAVIAGLLVSERITQPLQRIVRAAEEIERGNYDSPIAVGGADEIGYLARRFDAMRQHERAYVHSLKEVARVKSEFIAVASHELRTPISVIRGFQEMLADLVLGPLTEKQVMAVTAIGEGTVTLEKIADNATRMAQIEGERLTLNREAHEVGDLVKAAVRTATDEARGRQVRVTVELDGGIPRLHVDGPRLTEAVANLVRNGLRFTPDGGRVDVRTRWSDPELVVEVEDDGVGIPPERQEQIFAPGFAVRDSRNHHSSTTLEFNSAGLGLGLAIARGIVEAHGGTLAVDSTPGRGSRFVLRLRPDVVEALMEAA